MRSIADQSRRVGVGLKLGVGLVDGITRLEELDRIVPGSTMDWDFELEGVRFTVQVRVAARGVKR